LYVSASINFQYHGMVERRLDILARRGMLGMKRWKPKNI